MQSKLDKNVPLHLRSEDNFFGHRSEEPDMFSAEGQLCCDIYQTRDAIVIKSTMAGVDPKNLDISISNDLLTIRGFREQEEVVSEADFYSRECYWGSFSRSIVLPQQVDHTKARSTLKHGILTIILPKKYKTTSIRIRHIND